MIKIRDEDNMYPMNCFKCNQLMEIINRPKKQDDDRLDLLCLNCNTEHVYLLDKKISIAYIPEVQNETKLDNDEIDTSDYTIHESGHLIDKPENRIPYLPYNKNDVLGKEPQTHFKFKDIRKTTIRISKINALSIEKNGDLCPDDKYYIYICNMNIDVEYRSEKLRDQDYEDLTNILTGLTK